MPWNAIQQFNNPNTCWNVWKSFITETLNRHAPIRYQRTRRNSVPWITPRIKDLMRNRDYHKKRAIKHASQTHWESFKKLRNEVNIQMRNAKSKFFHKIKGRYTRGSLLPQHAPATRSRSKAPSSAPTISSEKICCAIKLLLPSFAPSYQTGLI